MFLFVLGSTINDKQVWWMTGGDDEEQGEWGSKWHATQVLVSFFLFSTNNYFQVDDDAAPLLPLPTPENQDPTHLEGLPPFFKNSLSVSKPCHIVQHSWSSDVWALRLETHCILSPWYVLFVCFKFYYWFLFTDRLWLVLNTLWWQNKGKGRRQQQPQQDGE